MIHIRLMLGAYLPEKLQPLLEWFENNYIGRLNQNGHGQLFARFSPLIWNLNECVLNGVYVKRVFM
jgi:hypothetical protein